MGQNTNLGVWGLAMFFSKVVLALSFRVALETLVGLVYTHHGPKWKSWGVHLAVFLSKLALELSLRVVLETLVGVVWALEMGEMELVGSGPRHVLSPNWSRRYRSGLRLKTRLA